MEVKMKFGVLILFLILILSVNNVFAQDFKAKEPVLITCAGQSSDVLMAKILAGKSGLDFKFDKNAKEGILDSVESVIIVSGGSIKGMGAAGIDKDQEYKRVSDLIIKAKKLNKKVICVHVGGQSRRGNLSDYFNKLAAENSDMIIVVKEGDSEDNFFSNIAKEKQIPIQIPEKIINITEIFKKIYGKE
jgi:hypothetical protein